MPATTPTVAPMITADELDDDPGTTAGVGVAVGTDVFACDGVPVPEGVEGAGNEGPELVDGEGTVVPAPPVDEGATDGGVVPAGTEAEGDVEPAGTVGLGAEGVTDGDVEPAGTVGLGAEGEPVLPAWVGVPVDPVDGAASEGDGDEPEPGVEGTVVPAD